MTLTEQQLADASVYVAEVRAAVLEAMAGVPSPDSLDPEDAFKASLDGLVAAMAFTAEARGIAPAKRDKRQLADEMRAALIEAMKAARGEIDMIGRAQSVANDPH